MVSALEIILYNVGFVAIVYAAIIFQKLGAMRSPKFGEEKNATVLKKLVQNKVWLFGILLNAVSVPYYGFLLSVASVSFVMVCQRAGIIVIFVFSVRYLKEKLSRAEIIGLILVYVSIVFMMSIVTNSQTQGTYAGDGPEKTRGFIFFAAAAAIEIAAFTLFKRLGKTKVKELLLAIGAGVSGVAGTLALKVVPLVLTRDLGMAPENPYVFNMFNFPELWTIMYSIFVPGSPYFFGSIYFWLWIGNFVANFFLLTMMYQLGRAGVTIPINTTLNFIVSVLFGYFMCGEPLDSFSWIGISLMVAGIFLTGKIESEVVVNKASEGDEPVSPADPGLSTSSPA
jgi:drug/metabolite transporter (DMT)-like permease